MNACKWYMSGSVTENSILLSVLPRLNKISINQSINLVTTKKEQHFMQVAQVQHPVLTWQTVVGPCYQTGYTFKWVYKQKSLVPLHPMGK